MSLYQLCDDGCNVLLTQKKMYAMNDKEVVIQGENNHHNGLWDIIHVVPQERRNIVKPQQGDIYFPMKGEA